MTSRRDAMFSPIVLGEHRVAGQRLGMSNAHWRARRHLAPVGADSKNHHGQGGDRARHSKRDEVEVQRQFDPHQQPAQHRADDGPVAPNA